MRRDRAPKIMKRVANKHTRTDLPDEAIDYEAVDREEDPNSEDSMPITRRTRRPRYPSNNAAPGRVEYVSISDDSGVRSESELDARPGKRRQLDSIPLSDFIYPPSLCEGYTPPLSPSKEKKVVEDFTRETPQSSRASSISDEDFVEFDLSHFSIYQPESNRHHPGELVGLQNLATKSANSWYCFDGILSVGLQRRYVQGVPFRLSSIGNYGHDIDGVEDKIWIQSELNEGSDVYYRLRAPSDEYARYHEGFVWLANLAKHFVDYLESVSDQGLRVSIHNFKAEFARWLYDTHGNSPIYQAWYSQYNRRDFRGHISANIEFLGKETNGTCPRLLNHPIWKELRTMDFIPAQKFMEKRTVVTPYVYDCFKHLKFGTQLIQMAPSGRVQQRRRSLGQSLQLMTDNAPSVGPATIKNKQFDPKSIAVGDVLGVPMDDADVSLWKDELSKWKAVDTCWYVLVQEIHAEKSGKRSFDIIWLYKPSDTTCAKMKYPHSKELFLSDNCSCNRQRITEDEALCKVAVAWNGSPGDSESDFFVRQTYLRNNAFVTLKECHKKCVHLRDAVKPPLQELVDNYRVGDTILYAPPPHLKSRYGLEPGEITQFIQREGSGFVIIRRLLRRRDLSGMTDARPNELVYSEETFTLAASKVKRKCFVRFYSRRAIRDQEVPVPYNRDGIGDAFYITERLVGDELEPIHSDLPSSMIQGPDFSSMPSKQRLRGLDLYCGGGNFGRGLEEGGGIRNTHAVDIDGNAIHTYWANLEDAESTKLFYGSVNDMLVQALKGNPSKSDLIPLPGDIDFISAGSPCPGFSVLNSNKDNALGLKNQSLVASVAAYIDIYRPKYALLENVVTMAQKGKRRDEDVLSQLICCVTGMGYQVQVFNLDAWSFGSPQTRCRLFVSIAAPGLEPPPHPGLSHSHPDGTGERGLGMTASGHAFGERAFKATPFEYVTAEEATADLPDIGDGRTFHCTYHPDHRMPRGISRLLKFQIEIIPTRPRGMNFSKTRRMGLMTQAELDLFPATLTRGGRPRHCVLESSHAWERIHPRKLFPTIATSASPACARTGRTLHWDQQRLITVLEARRAQSFPDDEVITGPQAKQWRIIGNSVARTVSLALGLSIWEACRKNSIAEKPEAAGIDVQVPYANSDSPISSSASARRKKSVTGKSEAAGIVVQIPSINNDSPTGSSVSVPRMKLTAVKPNAARIVVRVPYINKGSPVSSSTFAQRKSSPGKTEAAGIVVQAPPVNNNSPFSLSISTRRHSDTPSPTITLRSEFESLGSKSLDSGDEASSTSSTSSSDRATKKVQKRRYNLPTMQIHPHPHPKKKIRMLSPPAAWDRVTLRELECEALSSLTLKGPMNARRSVQYRQLQSPIGTSPDLITPSKHHTIHSQRQSAMENSHQNRQKANNSTLKSYSRELKTIDIISEDDDLIFISSNEKKRAYVPVNNEMFVAYKRTHEMTRVERQRRRRALP